MIDKMRTSGRRERAPQSKSSTHRKEQPGAESGLLLYPQNRVLCRLGDSEFDDGLGWNFDFLLRLRIEARASLPFLLYELAKSRQDEFSVLFDRFVGERAERIKEYSSGSLGGLGGSSECDLKFRLCHVYTSAELALSAKQADALSPRVPLPSPLILRIFLVWLQPNPKFHRQEIPAFVGAHQ